LANGDTLAGLGLTVTVSSPTATAATAAGTYADAIVVSVAGNAANYAIATAFGDFAVTKRALTIAANDQSKVYGDANPALTYTANGLVNGDTLTGLGLAVTVTSPAITALTGAGTYADAITVDVAGITANYDITAAAGDFTVTKRVLMIAANDQTKAYGDANPALTYTTGGLVNGDTLAGVGLTVTLAAPSITVLTGAGAYSDAITVSVAGTAANYEISAAAGDFTVTKRALTIKANDQAKIQGNANPVLTYAADGLANNDTLAGIGVTVSLSTTASTTSAVGSYVITATGTGLPANYSVAFVNGTLMVGQQSLTFTGKTVSETYGASWTLASLVAYGVGYTAELDGALQSSLPSGLTVSVASVTDGDGNAVANAVGADAGTYTVTYAVSGTSTYSYAGTFAGALTITRAALTVTANSVSKAYGDAMPSLGYTVAGLVNGDTTLELTGSGWSPTETTSAGQYSPVGGYGIGFDSQPLLTNYAVTYVGGELTVTPRSLTITANNQQYFSGTGTSLPTLTYTVTGLVNGDALATLPTLTTTATATSVPGTYAINVSGASAANYAISYQAGTLAVYAGTNSAALVTDTQTGISTLYVYGTKGSDKVTITSVSTSSPNTVLVTMNKKALGTFSVPETGQIVVHGLNGSDTITVGGQITRSAWIYGDAGNDKLTGGVGTNNLYGGDGNDKLTGGSGTNYLYGDAGNDTLVGGSGTNFLYGEAGNDTLTGGSGSSVLLGGDGNDRLTGGAGRSILIGGSGSDSLIANKAKGESLLIGGSTAYDGNQAALQAIMNEWSSGDSYSARVDSILGNVSTGQNGSYAFNSGTVLNDSAVDKLVASGSVLDFVFQSANDKLSSSNSKGLKWILANDKIVNA
jgi:hypothetical protein